MSVQYMSVEKREKRGLAGYGITLDRLKMLEDFVELVKFNYNILDVSRLRFLKDWLVNDLKATIPKARFSRPVPPPEDNQYRKDFAKAARKARNEPDPDPASSSEEDDYPDRISHKNDKDFENRTIDDFDESCEEDTGDADNGMRESSSKEEKVETEDTTAKEDGDNDKKTEASQNNDLPRQEMGNDAKVPTEEEIDMAMEKRQLGMQALNREDYATAIKHFNEGILLNSKNNSLFVKRATAYLRLGEWLAAMKDGKKALSINKDSAPALRVLGEAERNVGRLQDALHHLQEAQNIDPMEETRDTIKEVRAQIREAEKREDDRKREAKTMFESAQPSTSHAASQPSTSHAASQPSTSHAASQPSTSQAPAFSMDDLD